MSGVRPARVEDLPRLGALAGELVRWHHALDPRRFLLVEDVEVGYARWFRSELANGDACIFAAEDDDGAVIGYAYGRMEERDWNALLDRCGALHDVWVEPRARQRGVGRALTSAVVRALEEKGAPRVLLHTATQNDAAQRLFESMGFRSTMIEMTRESGAGWR